MTQFSDLLKAADLSLYSAKRIGRNNVYVADTTEEPIQRSASLITATTRVAQCKPPIDFEGLLTRCGGDAKFATAVRDKFSKQAPVECERIEAALKANDIEAARRAAHSLKSMAAYMGASTITECARAIEDAARQGSITDLMPRVVQVRSEVSSAIEYAGAAPDSPVEKCALV
jgi:HPt (histidine-containing phosphotransfer) domain-containing protein